MAINYDDFLHARGEMPSSPEPARTFSPPSPPSSPPTSSGLAEDTSNVVAFNGAATTNRDESVIAVMRVASSTASMRSAFGQWRDVATDEAARKSLSGLAFRMEGGYSSEEDEVETAKAATNAVDQSTGRKKTDGSPTDRSSNTEFVARRVAVTNYNPLDRPQLGVGLAEHALLGMSPFPAPEATGGQQTPPATLATGGGQNLAGAGVSPTPAPVGGLAEHALSGMSPFTSSIQSPGSPR